MKTNRRGHLRKFLLAAGLRGALHRKGVTSDRLGPAVPFDGPDTNYFSTRLLHLIKRNEFSFGLDSCFLFELSLRRIEWIFLFPVFTFGYRPCSLVRLPWQDPRPWSWESAQSGRHPLPRTLGRLQAEGYLDVKRTHHRRQRSGGAKTRTGISRVIPIRTGDGGVRLRTDSAFFRRATYPPLSAPASFAQRVP